MPDLRNKHIVVMGLGRFGGGAAVARYAVEQGAASVVISDRAPAADLAQGLALIDDLVSTNAVRLALGAHDPADLNHADTLIVNPAVSTPWNNPFIRAAREKGVTLETEIALAIDRLEQAIDRDAGGAVIAITGSVGKSTTAAMIHHALRALARPTVLGGNIGGSLLPVASTLPPDTVAVLELSSAMLHWLRETRPAWGPDVAVLTAFEPNHLDWHADLAHYRAAKQHLLDALASANTNAPAAVLAPAVRDWPVPPPARTITPEIPHDLDAILPGDHNRSNATLAGAAVHAATGIDPHDAARAAATFPGLPHRLAFAGTRRGVTAYNDSKSTTPGTTAAAVAAVRERHDRVWLIAGGADKGIDLSALAALDTTALLTIGTTGPAIAAAASAAGRTSIECATLDAAVREAARLADPGDAILLSPACASWDQFPNYEARGDAFIALLDTHLGAPDA